MYQETANLPYKLNAWAWDSFWVFKKFVLKEAQLREQQLRAMRRMWVSATQWYDDRKNLVKRYMPGVTVVEDDWTQQEIREWRVGIDEDGAVGEWKVVARYPREQ